MDIHRAELAEFQKQLKAKGAELPQLSAKHSAQSNIFSSVKLQSETGDTVLDDRKSFAGNCEHPSIRARVAR